jgi:hypothetical protein
MFDWLRKLHGEGKIRAEVMTADGRQGIVKVPYIGDINTLNKEEFRRNVIDQVWVNKGIRVTDVKLVGWY